MAQPLPNLISHSMAGGGAGELITLPKPCAQVKLSMLTGGAALVRVQQIPYLQSGYVAPTAPVAAPVADSITGNYPAGWVPMVAGDTITTKLLTDGSSYQKVEIWTTGVGVLVADGT